MNPFLERRPYVYAIMWTKHNTAYIGVRYGKNCHPDELWKEYFTSSRHVADFRKIHGEPDHIDVIEVFLTQKEAIDAEEDILRTFDLHHNPVFLNKNCAGAIVMDAAVRAKLSAAKKGKPAHNKGKPGKPTGRTFIPLEVREKIRATALAKGMRPPSTKGRKATTEENQAKAERQRQAAPRYDVNGMLMSLLEISNATGIGKATLWHRIKKMGLTAEQAIARSGVAL